MKTALKVMVAFLVCTLLPLSAWGKEDQEYVDRLLKEGMGQYARHDYEGAIRILESALKEEPQDVRILFYLGYAYYKNGSFADARATFEAAYRLHPDYTPMPNPPLSSP